MGKAMKRSMRTSIMTKTLTEEPFKFFRLEYFEKLLNASKTSISEDLGIIQKAMEFTGTGYIETFLGSKGGVRFVPTLDDEKKTELKEELVRLIESSDRILGGGFLYTSDLMFDPKLIDEMALYFVDSFRDRGANYVATIETKGVPLGAAVARILNLPLVVIRRESKVSEGSTVSINYFSNSYDRIQKMSISKRAVKPGSKAIVIDDFMRGGGSLKGIVEILGEFNIKTVGVGVAFVSKLPERKKIKEYKALVEIESIDEERYKIKAEPYIENIED